MFLPLMENIEAQYNATLHYFPNEMEMLNKTVTAIVDWQFTFCLLTAWHQLVQDRLHTLITNTSGPFY